MKRINIFFLCLVLLSTCLFAYPKLTPNQSHEFSVGDQIFEDVTDDIHYYYAKHLRNNHRYIISSEVELESGLAVVGQNLVSKSIRCTRRKSIYERIQYVNSSIEDVEHYDYTKELNAKLPDFSEEFPWTTKSCKHYTVYKGDFEVIASPGRIE